MFDGATRCYLNYDVPFAWVPIGAHGAHERVALYVLAQGHRLKVMRIDASRVARSRCVRIPQ